MKKKTPESSSESMLRLRIRVFCGGEAALGPGRAELLLRIKQSGSIVQAAREMELSYMKAWKLIQSMNRCFVEPLVDVRRGGRAGGSARLTETGTHVLGIYQEMERRAREACQESEAELARLAAPGDAG